MAAHKDHILSRNTLVAILVPVLFVVLVGVAWVSYRVKRYRAKVGLQIEELQKFVGLTPEQEVLIIPLLL